MNPRIDVVIPIHNGDRWIGRAINSVLTQDGHLDVRVWCIDDGSTDNTPDLLRQLATENPRITVVTNQTSQGPAAARNIGASSGNSEFIAFIDQDDQWRNDSLILHMAGFRANPEIGYTVGHQMLNLENGHMRPEWCRQEWLEKPQAGFLPSALVVRRSTWTLVGDMDTTLPNGGDDVDWFVRARALAVPYRLLDDVVVDRYIHNANLSSDIDQSNATMLELIRKKMDAAKGNSHRVEIDVVIPVRDVDDYLAEAIDSALTQTGVMTKVFVVDAGSMRAIELIDRHRNDPRVTLIRHDVGVPAGSARNIGTRHGTASYMSFLDGDDVWPPNRTAELLASLMKLESENEKAFAVGTVTHFADSNSDGLAIPDGTPTAYLAGGILLTRAAWNALGEFDPELKSGEFIEWLNRREACGVSEVVVDSISLRRRVHRQSTTARESTNRDEYLKVVRKWMNRTS